MTQVKRIQCKCGCRIADDFRSKWRHMVRKHPDHMVRRILPLVFLPVEELRAIGIEVVHAFIRKIQE